MENASKALIMAGGMLIGIIIISIGVILFAAFGGTSRNIQEQVDSRVLAEFNNNFEKYLGSNCTIHDIVSLANFARKNNADMEYDRVNDANKADYVHVFLKNIDLSQIDPNDATYGDSALLSQNSTIGSEIKYYKCTKIEYNQETKRVSEIVFAEI